MRALPILFCFSMILMAAQVSSVASAQSETHTAEQRASARVFQNMMATLKAVEKAIGKSVPPDQALKIASCSEQAAHKGDPGKVGDGVEFSKIDADKAIEACKNAYNSGSDKIGHVIASLSRAYNKAENYALSLRYAKEAANSGYPFGDVMMAIHYQYGDGVEKNKKQQFRWYKKAAAKGVTFAMGITSSNYLKGDGTAADLEEAYFWAFNAVENNDPMGFYHLANALEKMAETTTHPDELLKLAKQSFNVAGANNIAVREDIQRINQKLLPNHIADDKVLFAKTIKGRNVDGIFYPIEASSNWYLGDKPLTREDQTYFYARTSYNNTIFTLWYKQGASPKSSGWFIDFLYAGSNPIETFSGVSVVSELNNKTNYINLDLAEPKVEALPGTYRLTGRISYYDVLLLQNAKQVKFYYVAKDKSTPTYTMNLNDTEMTSSAEQGAQSVLKNLTGLVSQSDGSCCTEPDIMPLSPLYQNLYKTCEGRELDYLITKQVKQNCYAILKSADQSMDYYTEPMKTNLSRLLKSIEAAVSDTPAR